MTTRELAPSLVEREGELAALSAAAEQAARGHGALWFVCAEGGGGKTRLMREFAEGLAGFAQRWGSAEPVAPPEPYLAVSRAFPEFAPQASHALSASRAMECLAAASAERPLFCVLDDLHYADEGTAGLLVRMASEVRQKHWLVVVALRPGEGVPALTNGMVEIIAQGSGSRLDLAPLSPSGIAAFVAELRGAPAEAAEVEAIAFDSGGNPWFVEALARGSGAMSAARDRIQVRLGRLERELPGSFGVLSSIAAVTRPVDFEVVATLCGGDSPALRALLRQLRDARVLEELDDGWRFRQELMRRAVLESMIAADRRDSHRALAEALEPAGNAVELAMHYAAASDPRAARWALQAARSAASIDAHSEALAQLRRALSFDLEPAARQEALGFAAYEALILFDPAAAARFAAEAVRIEGGHHATLTHAHIAAAAANWELGHAALAKSHAAGALGISGPRISTRAGASTAVQEMMIAAADSDLAMLGASVSRARATNPADLGLEGFHSALQAAADVFEALGKVDSGGSGGEAALAAIHRLESLGEAAPMMATGVQVLAQLVYAYRKCALAGTLDEASLLYAEIERRLPTRGTGWTGRVNPYRELELTFAARNTEARALAALQPEVPGGSDGHAVALFAQIRRECRFGTVERAREASGGFRSGDSFVSQALPLLAEVDLAQATPGDDLRAAALALYHLAEPRPHARLAGEATVALARATGEAPAAPPWLAAGSSQRIWWDWASALVSNDRTALRDVSSVLQESGLAFEAALALEDAGEFEAAYRGFRDVSATSARERTSAKLRQLRRPVPRRTRASLAEDGLTDSEREICRLVAEGVSNAEIAERLTISVRTVETHLSNIYRKSNRKGRVALALWWRERDDPAERGITSS